MEGRTIRWPNLYHNMFEKETNSKCKLYKSATEKGSILLGQTRKCMRPKSEIPFLLLSVSTHFIVVAVRCVDIAARQMTLSTQIHTQQLLLLCVLC